MNFPPDYTLYRWDFASRKVTQEATKMKGWSVKVLVTPDARLVALNTGGQMGPADITLWAVPSSGSWKEAAEIKSAQAIAFTPDSRFLAARIHGAEGISLWERASAAVSLTLPEKSYHATLAFSPTGLFVALGEESGDIVLRDILAGKEIGKLRGHRGRITSLAFAGDGKTLVSGSSDLTALVWDVTSLLKPAPLPRQELDAAKRKALWEQLGRVDPGKAFAAIRILVGNPQQGVRLLREEVQPAAPLKVSGLIGDLDSNRFDVHHRAMIELRQMGDLAFPALKKALSEKPDLDLRRRIEEVLSDIYRGALDPEQIRLSRALLALEYINTSEAHDLLKRLAGGVPGAWLTEEARAALKRLRKPSPE
jgi:hypothetical protein